MNNFEPDWNELPEWANFAVYDSIGCLFAYDQEPVPKYEGGYWVPSVVGGNVQLVAVGAINSYEWHDVLYKRDKN